jgi:phage terminase large subunit-like protein
MNTVSVVATIIPDGDRIFVTQRGYGEFKDKVLRWMMDNVYVRQDPAGNIKMDKEKSTERIDAAVATVMALDRAIRNIGTDGSVYDDRGILVF